MNKTNLYKYLKTSPEIISLAVMYYIRYPLSYRQVEDILYERGIDTCHETIRYWVERFDLEHAAKISYKRKGYQSNWQWHLDEVFVKIKGERYYLWRAVDHEGEVLESFVTKRRNKRAALKFLRKTMKKNGSSSKVITDKVRSHGAALKELGATSLQDTTQYLNNRCENSHLPFRRKERSMQRFRKLSTLQKFTSIHGHIYNHFNHERHLQRRESYKKMKSVALNQWQELCGC